MLGKARAPTQDTQVEIMDGWRAFGSLVWSGEVFCEVFDRPLNLQISAASPKQSPEPFGLFSWLIFLHWNSSHSQPPFVAVATPPSCLQWIWQHWTHTGSRCCIHSKASPPSPPDWRTPALYFYKGGSTFLTIFPSSDFPRNELFITHGEGSGKMLSSELFCHRSWRM